MKIAHLGENRRKMTIFAWCVPITLETQFKLLEALNT